MNFKRKNSGMAILSMVLLVVALLAVIGGIVAASRSNTGATAEQSTKLLATSVVDQGNNVAAGVSIMLSKGRSMIELTDNSTDDGTGGLYGLYNPSVGGTQVQTPAPDATNTATKWILKIDSTKSTDSTRPVMVANGIGTASADYVVVLGDVKLAVCQQINAITHGTVITADPDPVTSGNAAAFTTPATAVTTDAVKHLNWSNGCVKTTDGKYAYFNVLKPL